MRPVDGKRAVQLLRDAAWTDAIGPRSPRIMFWQSTRQTGLSTAFPTLCDAGPETVYTIPLDSDGAHLVQAGGAIREVRITCFGASCRAGVGQSFATNLTFHHEKQLFSTIKQPVQFVSSSHFILYMIGKGFLIYIVLGSFMAISGIATLIWKPVDIMLTERLRMTKGLPPYDWWKSPPDEVLLSAYVFNITNAEDFLSGKAEKLHVQEVGPYIFREKLYHTNVKFNDNGTMTYTATRVPIFLPEMNTLSLDDKIIVANLATLGMPSYMWDASFVTRLGLSMLMSRMKSEPFHELTVNDYFWNFTDPLLKFTNKIAPQLVPVDNVGILHEIYRDFVDNVTVLIGVENGPRNFFKIDKFRGRNGLGVWENETCDSVQGSSEGVGYPQDLQKSDSITYLRKTVCRTVTLRYTKDVTISGITGYQFELPNDTWAREDPENTCFRTKLYPRYPSGVEDVSPCYFNLPIVASFPHFMSASPEITSKLDGLNPDFEKHGSVAIVEPVTGVPLTAWARSQCSLYIQDMKGFPKFRRLSKMAIPMFWLEYKQVGLPYYIRYSLYTLLVLIAPAQLYISLGLLILAFIIFSRVSSKMFSHFLVKKKDSYTSLNVIYSRPNDSSKE